MRKGHALHKQEIGFKIVNGVFCSLCYGITNSFDLHHMEYILNLTANTIMANAMLVLSDNLD